MRNLHNWCMRLILIFFVLAGATIAQTAKFPSVPAAINSFNASQSKWQIVSRHSVKGLTATVYSFRFLPNGTQAVVATADFRIHLIDLATNGVVWSVFNKMNLEREYDGHTIFDVSPDGAEFLCNGQIDENSRSGERTLFIRSTKDGSVIKSLPAEFSKFYSIEADKDHRYPGKTRAEEHLSTGSGPFWMLTISTAKYIESGAQILTTYQHNMTGPHMYDRRAIVYSRKSLAKLRDFQLVADPAKADFSQPAGFTTGHFWFPVVYSRQKKSTYHGTSFGRVHEMTFAAAQQNQKNPLAEKKNPGQVIFIPLSDSPDMAEKDAQIIRHLSLSASGKTLYVTAGYENYMIQLYGVNTATKKEIFRTPITNVVRTDAMGDSYLIVSGQPFYIANTVTGEVEFVASSATFDSGVIDPHPTQRKILINTSGGEFLILGHEQGADAGW